MEEKPVLELRLVITASDYDRLRRFYCDGLGLQPSQEWPADQGKATVLPMGQATLEVFDEQQASTIDQLEVGKRVSGQIRLALRVPDLDFATKRLLQNGAVMVQGPVRTPWGDTSVRMQDPQGMQVTLFQNDQQG
jgi:lactoylglutathione lyase